MFDYYLGEVQTVSIDGRVHAYSSSSVLVCHPSSIESASPPVVCFHFTLQHFPPKATPRSCYYPSLSAYLHASASRVPVEQHSPSLLSALEQLCFSPLMQRVLPYEPVRAALFPVERVRGLERQLRHLQQHKQFVL